MPKVNSTRGTMLPSSFSWATAFGAMFVSAVGKILTVFEPVALFTKGYPITYVKAVVSIIRPRLDMMGVNRALRSTSLAGVVVSLVDCFAPHRQLGTESATLTVKGSAIFPSIRRLADSRFASTATGTEGLTERSIGHKSDTAGRANLGYRRIALLPACLRAIVRSLRAICPHFKRGAAGTATGLDTVLSGHIHSITEQGKDSKYIAVSLERMAGMGLNPRLANG